MHHTLMLAVGQSNPWPVGYALSPSASERTKHEGTEALTPSYRPKSGTVKHVIGNLAARNLTVPVADPAAALQFCQALAGAVDSMQQGIPDIRLRPQMSATRNEANSQPVLSIVIPVFNEEENIETLHARLTTVLRDLCDEYEIIYVDDGSQDRSQVILQRMETEDVHVTVIELARNFGHQVAISAGLEHSRGRAVCIMDAEEASGVCAVLSPLAAGGQYQDAARCG